MHPTVRSTDETPLTEVRPGVGGRTCHTDRLSVTVYRYAARSRWEDHSHPEEQVTVALGPGEIEFVIDGRRVRLRGGDVAIIPGGAHHSAEVGDDLVVTVNIFSPSRRPAGSDEG